ARLLDANGEGKSLLDNLKELIGTSDIDSEDLKNLSIVALVTKLMVNSDDPDRRSTLSRVLDLAKMAGVENQTPKNLGLIE
ncbi:MAG TPA: hypothetical protein VJ949_13510, partial [Cryomorphaceae bacterium]|nr:hypothetical protein [Cryomorphaceae bacterium]